MSRLVHAGFVVVLGAAVLGGCIIDTVPTPDDSKKPGGDTDGANGPNPWAPGGTDVPAMALTGVYYTSYVGAEAILVVAREGTVPEGVWVGLENPVRQAVARRPASANGSFALSIDASEGDAIDLEYWVGDVVAGSSSFTVQQAPAGLVDVSIALGAVPAGATGGTPVLSISSEAGAATIWAGPGTLDGGLTLAVANSTKGSATSTVVGLDGSFVARLAGDPGDMLVLFPVDPGTSPAGGPSITIPVP